MCPVFYGYPFCKVVNLAALCVVEVTVVCWCVCLSAHNFLFFHAFFLSMVIATAIKFYQQLVAVVSYHFKLYKRKKSMVSLKSWQETIQH